ncbi:Oidioi.mRNA.OKI2018_I69.XSR.g13993.t1.cds [Oikopleura dioica]|uniref:Kinase n=1 Tax=Oikopleura dioica TaxID=34765 RepID=A0ABN7SAC2_OIKDI|nr:Oidioi.mRNA.OKI2018_I69.XSR.g13993.t1.cds [Oikopleura dioica]
MSRDSKSPSINFDTDSSDSDSEPDLPPAHTPSPLLAPTPTMAERLKRANEDLNSNPSPPSSRISRIGFREDMEDVLEFDDNPSPRSPSPQQNSTPQPPPATIVKSPSPEPQVEPQTAPQTTSEPPVEEAADLGTGGRFLTEVNGTFQMDFQDEKEEEEDELPEDESPIKSKRHDPIPEYKSPYGLTKEQKKLGRQRKLAQHRKKVAEEELEQVERSEKREEAERSFNAWLKQKNQMNKKLKPKDDVNSSRMMKEQLSEEERNDIWEEWKRQKAQENHRKRLVQHQQEIEKMEGLYVRSRQENDKAFRKWVKKKEKEERIQQEIHYRQVQITKAATPEAKILRSLCPRFYGVVESSEPNAAHSAFIRLEDLTRPFRDPCICDIKMGRVTYDPDATEEKKRKESVKYPPLVNTGFQLLGCRISSDSGSTAQKLDKKWGRSLDEDQLVNIGLGKFLSSAGPYERNILIIKGILERLLLIRDFFAAQTSYRFYASSLLILYEGYSPAELGSQGSSDSEDDRWRPDKPRVDVRMIDFAHVWDGDGCNLDENYLFGLNKLILAFESLLIEGTDPQGSPI